MTIIKSNKLKNNFFVVLIAFNTIILYGQNERVEKPDSVAKMYYNTGQLLGETPYKNGKVNGVQKIHYKSGEIVSEVPFVDNLANGISKTYYKGGKLWSETPYVNGKITGTAKDYKPNGKLEGEVKFIDNKGYSKGGFTEEIPYGNGNITGVVKYFYPNGTLMLEAQYVFNIRNGFWKTYDKNGNLFNQFNYVDGEEVNKNNLLSEIVQGLQQASAYNNALVNRNSQTLNDYFKVVINNNNMSYTDAIKANNTILENSTPTINDTYNKISDNTVNAESSASTNGGQYFNTNAAASKKCAAETEANWKETLVYKDFENDKLCMKKSYKAILKLTEMLLINCGQYLPPAEKEGYNKTISSLTNQINNTPDCVALIFETPKQGTKNNNKPNSQTQQPVPSGKNTNIAQ